MTHWKTDDIIKALSNVPGIMLAGRNPGEDYTTEGLTYKVAGASDNLYVRGFSTDRALEKNDDVDVEMIELTSEYSDGEESSQPANIIARAQMTVALTIGGYTGVVRSLEQYF